MKYKEFLEKLNGRCPFCTLKKSEILKENKTCAIILCRMPYIEGHLLIIPKRCISEYYQLKLPEKKDIERLLSWAIKNIKKKYGNFSVMYREGDSAVVGGSIKHFHIHLLPNMKLGIDAKDAYNRNVFSDKEYYKKIKDMRKMFH